MKRLLFFLAFCIFLSSLASAQTTIYENITISAGLASLELQTDPQGANFSIVGGKNITLAGIVRMPGDNGTMCYLYSASQTLLANSSSFTGNTCNIGYNLLSNNTYIVAFNDTGGAYAENRSVPGNTPQNGTYINWTFGWGSNTQYPNTRSVIGLVFNVTIDGAITSVLNSPTDGSVLIGSNITFNSTGTSTGGFNLTNASLYVWSSSGSLFNKTSSSYTGTINTSTITLLDLGNVTGNFQWNYLWCGINGTTTLCDFANSNFSFVKTNFNINSTSYNTTAYETSHQVFYINVTTDPSVIAITPFLIYQGTSYPASSSCAGSFCNISRSIDIPLINSSGLNHSFYWNLRSFDGLGYTILNSSTMGQNISRITLWNCNTPQNYTLNFTAYDEQSLARINPYAFAGTFGSWLGGGSVYRNFSFSNTTLAEQSLCISPRDVTFHTNADIEYNNVSNFGYTTRNYYLRNASLVNTTNNIPLYLLRSTAATSFILEVTDANLNPLEDVLIYIQRYYPGNNSFSTVQIAVTDENGKSVGFFETETVEYKFLLVKDGQVLLSTDKRKVFPESSPFTLIFRVGGQASSVFTPYSNLSNLVYSLSYNETTRMVTYVYIDTSGTTSYGRLLVQMQNPSRGAITICNVNSSQASATLLCNVTGYNGTIIAKGFISRSPEQLVAIINSIINTAREVFGENGLLLGLLIILAVAMITIYNQVLQIISVNVVILFLSIIGIITFSPIFIFGFMAVSTIILIVLRL